MLGAYKDLPCFKEVYGEKHHAAVIQATLVRPAGNANDGVHSYTTQCYCDSSASSNLPTPSRGCGFGGAGVDGGGRLGHACVQCVLVYFDSTKRRFVPSSVPPYPTPPLRIPDGWRFVGYAQVLKDLTDTNYSREEGSPDVTVGISAISRHHRRLLYAAWLCLFSTGFNERSACGGTVDRSSFEISNMPKDSQQDGYRTLKPGRGG
ncbi:hypothetical protein O3P69_002934 [Scylla paramamosain]|uniref:Uncharacterized protein n=1 Tax=Scylla paramamosain TaxID=85552 RepID=A0AAW0UJQ8_SCYPA